MKIIIWIYLLIFVVFEFVKFFYFKKNKGESKKLDNIFLLSIVSFVIILAFNYKTYVDSITTLCAFVILVILPAILGKIITCNKF